MRFPLLEVSTDSRFVLCALANRCLEMTLGSSSFGYDWLYQRHPPLSLGPGSHTLSPSLPYSSPIPSLPLQYPIPFNVCICQTKLIPSSAVSVRHPRLSRTRTRHPSRLSCDITPPRSETFSNFGFSGSNPSASVFDHFFGYPYGFPHYVPSIPSPVIRSFFHVLSFLRGA